MNDRRVTVFGGSGFIGRHIVRKLAAEGAVVRVAGRDPEQALSLKPMGSLAQIVPLAADVCDPPSVRAAVAGADAVINLVGILFENGRQAFRRVHVAGAETVATAAREAGARALVQVSALGADAQSKSAYARTKAEGEAAVLKAFPNATILRPSVVFGPGDGFLTRFAAMARYLPVLPVIGASFCPHIKRVDGQTQIKMFGSDGPRFQPVYVADVAAAVVAALGRKDARGRLYELGGPRVYTFKELMELMLAVTRRRRLLVPVPFGLAAIQAFFLGHLPGHLLTLDQVELLKTDNVASAGAPGLDTLGVQASALDAIAPLYLSRFRPWAQTQQFTP